MTITNVLSSAGTPELEEGLYAWHLHPPIEVRWKKDIWESFSKIVTPGIGLWEQGRGIPQPDSKDTAGDYSIESVLYPDARLIPTPVHITTDRIDVGHEVICVAGASVHDQTGIVRRRVMSGGTVFIEVEGFAGDQLERHFAVLVPGGDCSRVEEALPGEICWPAGARVSWTEERAGTTGGGIVVEWTNGGLARIFDDRYDTFVFVDRSTLISGVKPTPRGSRRRWVPAGTSRMAVTLTSPSILKPAERCTSSTRMMFARPAARSSST